MSKGVTGRVRPCEVRMCEQMHKRVSLWEWVFERKRVTVDVSVTGWEGVRVRKAV